MRTSRCFSNVNQIYCSTRVDFEKIVKTPVTGEYSTIKDKMRGAETMRSFIPNR